MRFGPVLAALLLICAPAAARAQVQRPIVAGVGGLTYDAHTRTTVEAGALIPFTYGYENGFHGCTCLGVIAGLGQGGQRLAVGPMIHTRAGPISFFGLEAMATLTHTSEWTRHARPGTTYVGVEGGITLMSVHMAFGRAQPATGPGPRDSIYTWNVGVRVAW
jgi:hypothetical protein